MSQLRTHAEPPVDRLTDVAEPTVPRHVLMAGGDERSRERRAARLREAGCQVSFARTSFETIVKACCHLPDVILLDEALGETEVAETTRLLATCPVTAQIPVIRVGRGRRLPERVFAGLQPATV